MKAKITLIFIVCGIFVTVSSSYAATLYISDTCTLIDAILSANTNTATGGCGAGDVTGTDTIVLEKDKVYRITAAYETSSDGNNGLPSITSSIRIIGQSAIIKRESDPTNRYLPQTRIFHISSSGSLILEKLSVEDGYSEKNGGGLFNRGFLEMRECTIDGNSSLFSGGGIFNKSGRLIIRGSSFDSNGSGDSFGGSTTADGGAIYTETGSVEIYSSIFFANIAWTGEGGAVFNSYDGVFRITQSSFIANYSNEIVAGVANKGKMIVSSSTFDQNYTYTYYHGVSGIYNYEMGIFSLYNSTISYTDTINDFSGTRDTIVYNAGQMEIINSTLFRDKYYPSDSEDEHSPMIVNKGGSLKLGNSIVADEVPGDDCTDDFTRYYSSNQQMRSNIVEDLGHNWFTDDSCTGVANGDPKLEPLAANGGSTKTHALSEDSELIDMGDDDLCSSEAINNFDQRGERRPQGEHCDIGSFEKRKNAGQSSSPSIMKLLLL